MTLPRRNLRAPDAKSVATGRPVRNLLFAAVDAEGMKLSRGVPDRYIAPLNCFPVFSAVLAGSSMNSNHSGHRR